MEKNEDILNLPESLDKLRANMVRELGDTVFSRAKITCDTCQFVTKCEYAYDIYNVDGDCLGLK